MSYTRVFCGILLVQCVGSLSLKCENYFTPNNVQLIVDYAKSKNVRHVIILEENIKLGKSIMYNYVIYYK